MQFLCVTWIALQVTENWQTVNIETAKRLVNVMPMIFLSHIF